MVPNPLGWTNPSGPKGKPGKLSCNPGVVVQFRTHNLWVETVVLGQLAVGFWQQSKPRQSFDLQSPLEKQIPKMKELVKIQMWVSPWMKIVQTLVWWQHRLRWKYMIDFGIWSGDNCSHGVTARTFWRAHRGFNFEMRPVGIERSIWNHREYQVWHQSHAPNPFIHDRQAWSICIGI